MNLHLPDLSYQNVDFVSTKKRSCMTMIVIDGGCELDILKIDAPETVPDLKEER